MRIIFILLYNNVTMKHSCTRYLLRPTDLYISLFCSEKPLKQLTCSFFDLRLSYNVIYNKVVFTQNSRNRQYKLSVIVHVTLSDWDTLNMMSVEMTSVSQSATLIYYTQGVLHLVSGYSTVQWRHACTRVCVCFVFYENR